jgi:phosphatidylinositol kinase/protein kinase (PI-3  family)
MFQQGDDIRQDMLTIQVIRMIETWWLRDGLDLRVVTFSCIPTGPKQGIDSAKSVFYHPVCPVVH